MKYMLLAYMDEKAWEALSAEEQQAEMKKCEPHVKKLLTAGKILDGAPLHSTASATTVRVKQGKRLITDGPFAETRELVAGFWIWECKSIDEAVEWVKKCPNPMPGEDSDIEIRPFYEAEDFGENFTDEARERVERLREQVEAKK